MAKTKISIAGRLVIFATCLAAALTMLSSRQTVHILNDATFFTATYKDWNSFQFFIAVNFLGAAYNLLVIILPNGSLLWKLVVVLDMVIGMLLVASVAAALETYSLLKNGSLVIGMLLVASVAAALETYSLLKNGSLDAKPPTLQLVPLVSELPDVFPDELPGIPIEKEKEREGEIKFSFDVPPDTQPISIPPYMMALAKLKELKD
uniref:CASP-like protein n=1 Tax=Nicotiana sylvestris TaxID=4096 RepID=A0A1U7W358_NICSY|nr:PREDICTED: CASP-like protein 1C1 [Nicotiana sylvestris]